MVVGDICTFEYLCCCSEEVSSIFSQEHRRRVVKVLRDPIFSVSGVVEVQPSGVTEPLGTDRTWGHPTSTGMNKI